jgi:hypothetical protein
MLIVVGGLARNIGKTSVAAGLIAAIPEAHGTAPKITQIGHGVVRAMARRAHAPLSIRSILLRLANRPTPRADRVPVAFWPQAHDDRTGSARQPVNWAMRCQSSAAF